jgi:hypothetical protein
MVKLRRIVGKDERSKSCREYRNISCASNESLPQGLNPERERGVSHVGAKGNVAGSHSSCELSAQGVYWSKMDFLNLSPYGLPYRRSRKMAEALDQKGEEDVLTTVLSDPPGIPFLRGLQGRTRDLEHVSFSCCWKCGII